MPDYLAEGVSYFEFWKLNPRALKAIAKGAEKKAKKNDEVAWNMGIYVLEAIFAGIQSVFPAENVDFEYPRIPHSHEQPTPEEREEARINREIMKAIAGEEAFIARAKAAGLPSR